MSQQLTFVILSTGMESFRELRTALGTQEGARVLVGGDDAEQVFPEIERLGPNACIIALGAEPEAGLRFVERVARECPRTAVICASRDASPDTILRSIRAGAREFLRLPVRPDEFATVYQRTAEFCAVQTEAPKRRGRVLSVFSSKGGTGTTFIATNLAASLRAPTVLLDLNLQAGDLGLFLGVEPKFSIADLVENLHRADDQLLRSYLTPHTANLALLAAPREADSADDIEAEHVFQVLEILRERHDHVVVNRFSKQIDLDLRQVERFLGERVAGYVQSDYKTAVNSINLGQPLVDSDPHSKIATELRQIAERFCTNAAAAPAPAREPRRGRLGSFFRREKAAGKEAVGNQLSAVG